MGGYSRVITGPRYFGLPEASSVSNNGKESFAIARRENATCLC
jgi:hypothetical protein